MCPSLSAWFMQSRIYDDAWSSAIRTYSTDADLATEGASLHLRPYHLPHRVDYGLRGTSDHDPYLKIIWKSSWFYLWAPFCGTVHGILNHLDSHVVATKEVQHGLAQVVLLNGFQTNPNVPGTEKVVGCTVQRPWLRCGPTHVNVADVSGAPMASLGQLFVVKGWNRSVVCLGVLWACYTTPELLKEGWCQIEKHSLVDEQFFLSNHP